MPVSAQHGRQGCLPFSSSQKRKRERRWQPLPLPQVLWRLKPEPGSPAQAAGKPARGRLEPNSGSLPRAVPRPRPRLSRGCRTAGAMPGPYLVFPRLFAQPMGELKPSTATVIPPPSTASPQQLLSAVMPVFLAYQFVFSSVVLKITVMLMVRFTVALHGL